MSDEVTEVTQTEPEKTKRKWGVLRIIRWALLIIVLILTLVQFMGAAKYEALVQVINEDRIGVNPTAEKLDFGDLPRNKEAVRTVTLQSSGNTASYIFIWKRGDIAELMKPNKNNFTLAPNTSEKLEFTVHIPNSAEYRYYKGKITIFKIPKFW